MGHHKTLFVHDDQEISCRIAVLQLLQVEADAEGSIVIVLSRAVGDDLLNIADLLAILIGEIDLISPGHTIIANSLPLIEVQAEDHVADLSAGRE